MGFERGTEGDIPHICGVIISGKGSKCQVKTRALIYCETAFPVGEGTFSPHVVLSMNAYSPGPF